MVNYDVREIQGRDYPGIFLRAKERESSAGSVACILKNYIIQNKSKIDFFFSGK